MAIAWWGEEPYGVHSAGWYVFKPGECARVFPDDSYDAHRYYYAETKTGEWKGNFGNLCVDPHHRFEFADRAVRLLTNGVGLTTPPTMISISLRDTSRLCAACVDQRSLMRER